MCSVKLSQNKRVTTDERSKCNGQTDTYRLLLSKTKCRVLFAAARIPVGSGHTGYVTLHTLSTLFITSASSSFVSSAILFALERAFLSSTACAGASPRSSTKTPVSHPTSSTAILQPATSCVYHNRSMGIMSWGPPQSWCPDGIGGLVSNKVVIWIESWAVDLLSWLGWYFPPEHVSGCQLKSSEETWEDLMNTGSLSPNVISFPTIAFLAISRHFDLLQVVRLIKHINFYNFCPTLQIVLTPSCKCPLKFESRDSCRTTVHKSQLIDTTLHSSRITKLLQFPPTQQRRKSFSWKTEEHKCQHVHPFSLQVCPPAVPGWGSGGPLEHPRLRSAIISRILPQDLNFGLHTYEGSPNESGLCPKKVADEWCRQLEIIQRLLQVKWKQILPKLPLIWTKQEMDIAPDFLKTLPFYLLLNSFLCQWYQYGWIW